MNNNKQPARTTQRPKPPENLFFYCRECEKLLDIKPVTLKVKCPNDATHDRIVYGSERSIKNFFKIKDVKFDSERMAREKLAEKADKL